MKSYKVFGLPPQMPKRKRPNKLRFESLQTTLAPQKSACSSPSKYATSSTMAHYSLHESWKIKDYNARDEALHKPVSSITHFTPKTTNTNTHGSLPIEQYNNIWSRYSPCCLHIQQQFTNSITCLIRLVIVNIFPHEVVHTEKATLKQTFKHHIAFHGKSKGSEPLSTSYYDRTLKCPYLIYFQHISSLPTLVQAEYNTSKKLANTSTS